MVLCMPFMVVWANIYTCVWVPAPCISRKSYSRATLLATIDVAEVPIVRLNIGVQCSRIARLGAHAFDNIHIRRGNGSLVVAGDPVLGARVAESPARRWQLRNNVILVRHSPKTALVRDVCSQCCVSDAWLAVCILRFVSMMAEGMREQYSPD